MFFRSKCPLDTHEKTWTEVRMQWLSNKLGTESLFSGDVVLPTEDFFPGQFGGTKPEIEQYGRIVGRQLGIQKSLSFEIGQSQLVGAPARLVRDQSTILIADTEMGDPVFLVSALAHELSRHRLIETQYMTGEEPDFESVVDLLTVYCGLGVFSANATARQLAPGTMPRSGYLASRVVGYALALYAWARARRQPAWSEYLRHDALDAMQRGLRYLAKSADCVFQPTAGPDASRWTVGQALEKLTARSASTRLAALWCLEGHGDFSADVSAGVQASLRDRDVAVRRAAAALTPKLANANVNLQDDLLDAIRDSDSEVRALAAHAIGQHGFSGADVELGLEPLLNDPDRSVLMGTATTLAKIGIKDDATIERLGKRFKAALVDCNYEFAQQLALPIAEMHGDIHEFANAFFAHDDELLEQARSVLEELDAETAR